MEWVRTAKTGDKVVCVNADGCRRLKYGATYTVYRIHDDLGYCPYLNWFGAGIDLFDEQCEPDSRGFAAIRFRPVQPRKTDITIFQRMLNTAPARVDEEA